MSMPPHRTLIRAAAALGLGLLWALACPWLSVLEPGAARVVAPALGAAGVLVGLVAAWSPSDGVRLLARLLIAGVVASAGAAGLLTRWLDLAPALALALCMAGATFALAVGLALWTAAVDHDETHSITLRTMVAGACGALAVSAWALASGHVLGQRYDDASWHAVSEARNLAAIAVARAPSRASLVELAPSLAPAQGYLVSLDGAQLASGGSGLPSGTPIAIVDEPHPTCHAGAAPPLPCARRKLPDGTALVVAVPPLPIAGGLITLFGLLGVGIALAAVSIGRLTVAATVRDLERVCRTLDELGRGPRGLDVPIVVASLDETGDLAAALARLRAHLAPTLAEYQTALDKAQQADRSRTDFLGMVSTELRSPLDQIVASARALLAPAAEPLLPEQAEDVRIVLSSSLHLCDLIEEVLDVSAIATGQVVLKLEDVDVGVLVGDVAKAQRPLVQQKGVEVKLEVASPSPRARVDERRLRQVVTNIVSNAAKFTDKGFIEVTVARHAGDIEIGVRDTGPGIDPKQLPRLFTEFVQLGSLKQRAHGTGLGLAICKRLVEAHGGKVSAESTVGVGSIFRVTLPVAGPPPGGAS